MCFTLPDNGNVCPGRFYYILKRPRRRISAQSQVVFSAKAGVFCQWTTSVGSEASLNRFLVHLHIGKRKTIDDGFVIVGILCGDIQVFECEFG